MELKSEFERKHPVLFTLAIILIPEFIWALLLLIGAGFVWAIRAGYAEQILFGLCVVILLVGIVVPAAIGIIAWRNTTKR